MAHWEMYVDLSASGTGHAGTSGDPWSAADWVNTGTLHGIVNTADNPQVDTFAYNMTGTYDYTTTTINSNKSGTTCVIRRWVGQTAPRITFTTGSFSWASPGGGVITFDRVMLEKTSTGLYMIQYGSNNAATFNILNCFIRFKSGTETFIKDTSITSATEIMEYNIKGNSFILNLPYIVYTAQHLGKAVVNFNSNYVQGVTIRAVSQIEAGSWTAADVTGSYDYNIGYNVAAYVTGSNSDVSDGGHNQSDLGAAGLSDADKDIDTITLPDDLLGSGNVLASGDPALEAVDDLNEFSRPVTPDIGAINTASDQDITVNVALSGSRIFDTHRKIIGNTVYDSFLN